MRSFTYRVATLLLLFAITPAWAEALDIVVYGASGQIGSVIVEEALQRGHRVTGVSRSPAKLKTVHSRFQATAGDVTDIDSVLETIEGADAVVVSVAGGSASNKDVDTVHARASVTLIEACERLGEKAPRVVQVGGATTMSNSRYAMKQAITQLPFEAPVGSPAYAMLFGHWLALRNYRDSNIQWTVATPPYSIRAGARTGEYRLGTETHVFDAEGQSRISRADFALAILDELEQPQFIGKRFTAGY